MLRAFGEGMSFVSPKTYTVMPQEGEANLRQTFYARCMSHQLFNLKRSIFIYKRISFALKLLKPPPRIKTKTPSSTIFCSNISLKRNTFTTSFLRFPVTATTIGSPVTMGWRRCNPKGGFTSIHLCKDLEKRWNGSVFSTVSSGEMSLFLFEISLFLVTFPYFWWNFPIFGEISLFLFEFNVEFFVESSMNFLSNTRSGTVHKWHLTRPRLGLHKSLTCRELQETFVGPKWNCLGKIEMLSWKPPDLWEKFRDSKNVPHVM